MENNFGNRNRSYQDEDWNQSDQGYDRNRDYQNRTERFNESSGSQGFNQRWQNSGERGGRPNYGSQNMNRQYENPGYNDDQNQRNYGSSNYGSSYDQNRGWRGNDWGNESRNYNQNYGRENYGNDYRNNRNERNWWDRTSDEVASWFGDDDAERRRRMDKINGPHRGKGPKGYSRSDERITEDINEKLFHDSHVDASNIEVKVTESEVILSGTVDSRESKRRAEDIAEMVAGVKNVQNQLRVSSSNTGTNIYDSSNKQEADQNGRKKSSLLS